ncbi:MAG: aminoacetone oxidase family FAD-binding enzyme [Acidobacteria bacterium]|nr:aminoacetone oxidase family FAD-binding enzyme [Acidobacteriota bacterium]
MNPPETHPIVIVGAGAAGLLAGIFAGRSGTPALLLETRPQPGAKIRVSGGGRCNVLPSIAELADFHTAGSPRSMRNMLFSWPLREVREFFERDLRIPLKVEDSGKVFPVSDRSKDIVDALLRACHESGSRIRAPFRVSSVRADERAGTGFLIAGNDGTRLRAERLILATGGLSLPKTGSDGAGLRFAKAMGHTIVPLHPALVPLLTQDAAWHELAGVSVDVEITAERDGRAAGRHPGSLLVTHRGFSGPAILDASYRLTGGAEPPTELRVHWGDVPDWDKELRAGGPATVGSTLRRHLPRRLVTRLCDVAGVSTEQRLSELPRDDRRRLVEALAHYRLPVSGNEGYGIAEVTAGGIAIAEIHPATMESRKVPGLFLCGEIVDVTGRLGGFNFLWAWVSGRRAGEAAARTR